MKYMLMIYLNQRDMDAAVARQMLGAYGAYTEAMVKAGVVAGGDRLEGPTTATTVRIVDGKPKVLNGPYAETKEQLAGYYIIDVPDLDAAISWAARCPGANGGVMEVRPVGAM
jgi:hypothetical protein